MPEAISIVPVKPALPPLSVTVFVPSLRSLPAPVNEFATVMSSARFRASVPLLTAIVAGRASRPVFASVTVPVPLSVKLPATLRSVLTTFTLPELVTLKLPFTVNAEAVMFTAPVPPCVKLPPTVVPPKSLKVRLAEPPITTLPPTTIAALASSTLPEPFTVKLAATVMFWPNSRKSCPVEFENVTEPGETLSATLTSGEFEPVLKVTLSPS